MKSIKVFTFGAFYLVTGIYSIGLSFFFERKVLPVSGYTAYVTIPDSLFTLEVALFAIFGTVFILASILEFSRTFRLAG